MLSARRRGREASGTAGLGAGAAGQGRRGCGAGRKRTKHAPHRNEPLLNSLLLPLPAPVSVQRPAAGNEQWRQQCTEQPMRF